MSGQEYTTNNKAYVAPVTAESTVAQVDLAEQQIRYQQIVLEEVEAEAARLEGEALESPSADEGAGSDVAGVSAPASGGQGGDEGKLYMDIGLEALGLKAVGAAIDFVEERGFDASAKGGKDHDEGDMPLMSKTIDQDIVQSTARKPGFHKAPAGVEGEADTHHEHGSGASSLLSRANIVSDSIRMESPQRLDGSGKFTETANWQGTNASMAAVQQVRGTMRQNLLENEQVYTNVQQVRMEHNSMLGQVNRMAPGLDLGNGPAIRPAELLREVKETVEEGSGGFI